MAQCIPTRPSCESLHDVIKVEGLVVLLPIISNSLRPLLVLDLISTSEDEVDDTNSAQSSELHGQTDGVTQNISASKVRSLISQPRDINLPRSGPWWINLSSSSTSSIANCDYERKANASLVVRLDVV